MYIQYDHKQIKHKLIMYIILNAAIFEIIRIKFLDNDMLREN